MTAGTAVVCAEHGHEFTTTRPPGTRVTCPVCLGMYGTATFVTVPEEPS